MSVFPHARFVNGIKTVGAPVDCFAAAMFPHARFVNGIKTRKTTALAVRYGGFPTPGS